MDTSPPPPLVVTERLHLHRVDQGHALPPEEAALIEAALRGHRPHLVYRVTARAEGAPLLGIAALAPHDRYEVALLAGVAFLPAARGHGYGREAGRALLALAFAEAGAGYVDALVAQDEAAAVTTAERLGLRNLGAAEGGPALGRYRTHQPPGGR